MNYYSDEQEWQWLFKNAIDWDTIIPLYFPSFPTEEGLNNKEEAISFMSEILDNLGNWSGNSISEMAPTFDKEGPGEVRDGRTYPSATLQRMYNEAAELGVFGLNVPKEFGGMGMPATLQIINLGMISRGYIGACGQLSFFNAVADMMHRFCPKHIQDKYIPLVIEGKSSGSMCMTEPGCGSDLGAIKTTATPTSEEGYYKLNGTKLFISNAGGGTAFILAKVQGAAEGLAGLSLFFAEQINEDGSLNYHVVKNEHKMGMHGAFTCEVLYENTKALLIGKEGEGFKYMLELMNEARICTGVQSVGGIEASIAYAKKYASERQQFGKPISELPLMKRNLQDMETERDALRALAADTISHYDIFQFLTTKKKLQGELNQTEEAQLAKALI
jgi:alkylation response protein AidB-like acyl-CoA dehydrogenase